MEGRLVSEHLATQGAPVESRKKSTESNGPKREIAKRQRPVCLAFNLASRQEYQPEHRLNYFPFRQNQLGDFADNGQPNAEAVVALRLIKGFEQFALLNAHEVAGFLLDVPDLHMREDFERGAVRVLDPPSPPRHASNPSRSSPQEADEAVCL